MLLWGLYEALELRAEYDARIKTLKECLPETKQQGGRYLYSHDDMGMSRPSPDFSLPEAREQRGQLDVKRRKLNSAIQTSPRASKQ